MRNPGHPPYEADQQTLSSALVDIRFRNGLVRRSVDPRKWRWKAWDWGESDWDIESWQPSK